METEQQKEAFMLTTSQKMEQVLQQVGLTADEYNAIGQAIQSDTQLQERVTLIASGLSQQEQE
ncbi:MAG: DUF4168 domain-containing protein, partial [Nitrosomonas sp.]|nr:DUF4168 domain-containing protein [Nitrosomonas sp.]